MNKAIQELTSLSQTAYQPSMQGENQMQGLIQGQSRSQQSIDLGGRMALDVSKIVAGIKDFGKTQYDLSVEATKRMAIDHTRSLSEEITSIESNANLSFDERRELIGNATNKLYQASGSKIAEDKMLQQEYDDIFTANARKIITSSLSTIDKNENQYNLGKEIEYAEETLKSAPESITMSNLETLLSSNLKQRTITRGKLEDMLLNTKLNVFKNKYNANPDSFFVDGDFNGEIASEIFSDFTTEGSVAKEAINSAISDIKDNYTKLQASRQKQTDDNFQLAIKESFLKDTSLSNINNLLKTVIETDSVSSDTRVTLKTMLTTASKGITGDLDKKQKKETESAIKNIINSMTIDTNSGTTMNSQAFHLLQTSDGEKIIENTRETIKNLHKDYPETQKLELENFDKVVRYNKILAQEISQGKNFKKISEHYDSATKTFLIKDASREVDSFFSKEQVDSKDIEEVSGSLQILNKVPTELTDSITDIVASNNTKGFIDMYNKLSLITSSGTEGQNNRNLRLIKNNKQTNTLLTVARVFTDTKTGNINAEAAINAYSMLNDPNNNDIGSIKSGIFSQLKRNFTSKYSAETIREVSEEIAVKALVSGTTIKDASKEFKELIKDRTYETSDFSAVDIKGQYTEDTFEGLTDLIKHMNPKVLDGVKLNYDINPITGGVKVFAKGVVMYSTDSSKEFDALVATISLKKKEYDKQVELLENKEDEINSIDTRVNPLGKASYDPKAKEELVSYLEDITDNVANKIKSVGSSISNSLDEMYRNKLKTNQYDARSTLIK